MANKGDRPVTTTRTWQSGPRAPERPEDARQVEPVSPASVENFEAGLNSPAKGQAQDSHSSRVEAAHVSVRGTDTRHATRVQQDRVRLQREGSSQPLRRRACSTC